MTRILLLPMCALAVILMACSRDPVPVKHDPIERIAIVQCGVTREGVYLWCSEIPQGEFR